MDDTIFAADFGDLIAGEAPKVYQDARTFFRNTHPAQELCKILQVVFGRLNNPEEAGATIRLSTGFGGGKTHALMAMWHLAHNIDDASIGIEVLPAAGRPKKLMPVAVDASKAGLPVFARRGKHEVKSLWGEIAFQLGGEKAWQALGAADNPEGQPFEGDFKGFFPDRPVMILLDELVVYMATLSDRGQGNLLAFLNKLAAIVANRPQTAVVVTDPADQRAYAKEAAKLGTTLTAAAVKLDDTFGRKMTDFDPIGNEAARVIVRRLFESVDPEAAQVASAMYHNLYERLIRESPGTVPASAAGADYAKEIVECYPFHPRLMETARDRLGALQEFNKSRGTLRLFARILRDIWEARDDLELITAGDVNWSSPRIQADLLQRLNRDTFKAAVSADIEKHAGELDGGARRGVYRRVASALLLESLPLQANSGLDPADLTLAVLRPDEAGPEPAEALDRLVGVCWHTYPMPGGRGWQFRYEPNIIRQIEERMGHVPVEDAKSRVLAEAQSYFSGPGFKLAPWPSSARQVPEVAELQLVLCEDERAARSICANADDADPKSPIPRRFQNAVVGVTATAAAFTAAVDRAQRLLAAEAIERDHRTGEAGKLVREQLQRVKPELHKQFRIQTCRAFDRVVLAGGMSYSIEEQYQVPDEQLLQHPHGQVCLRKFLDAKNLIYQPGDALDVGRFLRDVLPGATPLADMPDVYTAKAVHERFLGAPGLRLIPDGTVVRQTLLKAVGDGKLVARFADGRTYSGGECVEGPDGLRRRAIGSPPSLSLDDSVLITRAESPRGLAWMQVSQGIQEGPGARPVPPPPPPPTPGRVTATTWEKVLEFAAQRPLVELRIEAQSPAVAAGLLALVQPLGADSLALSVNVSGNLKDGGTMNFAADGVRPTHATKPLPMAQMIFTALGDGATYEAGLALQFGTVGRAGMEPVLRQLAEAAPAGLIVRATFERPPGAAA